MSEYRMGCKLIEGLSGEVQAGDMNYVDMKVWQRAVQLAEAVIKLVRQLPREERFGMRPQITRAAVSVASNIAEGWTRETSRDKAYFLAVAQGSLAELDTQLLICENVGWIHSDAITPSRELMQEVGKMLSTSRHRFRDHGNFAAGERDVSR